LARALVKCPSANRVWHDDRLLEFSSVDVGLQVAVEDGLLAPVIRRADSLGLAGIAQQRSRLVTACRAGRLPADAVAGAACSLSNLGISRADEFAAIIMPSQSSILAVGCAAPRPWVAGGTLCVHTTMRLCLSVDHRVMDGLAAARFIGEIVEALENPSRIISPTNMPSSTTDT
jgi:pyruvate dehydrogenase E2 component (dihydrolipoamide acetyltransferase)